jgi:hypothetical protein
MPAEHEVLARIESCWLARLAHASGGMPGSIGTDASISS